MLSPHEYATLMLVKDCPEQIDLTREELDVLIKRHLITMEQPLPGTHCPCLTNDGNALLRNIKRAP